MPDGMKHSRTEPLARESDSMRSDDAAGVSGDSPIPNAPLTPENQAHLEKAVSERFADPQDLELFMLAIEGSQDGIWDWNIENDTLYLSDRHLEILGYDTSSNVLSPSDWVAMFHPEDQSAFRKSLAAYFRGETETYSSEVRVRRRDGGWS